MGKRGKHKHKFRPQPAVAQPAVSAGGVAQLDAADADEALGLEADAEAPAHGTAGEGDAIAEDAAGHPAEADAPAPAGGDAPMVDWPAAAVGQDGRSPFLVLADYEQRSLAHVAGLPEQLDAPGLWRGVAYRVGRHRLASGFDEVVEILPLPALTHVPGALPWMLGVANIRGALLPVVDLKQFLEGERTVMHERQRVLVVRQPGGDVAVTIDELYGQRSFVDEQGIEAAAVADGRYAHFVDRAYRMNGQDWGVFSLDRLARTPEFRQAAA